MQADLQGLDGKLHSLQGEFESLEDALLLIEEEKADTVRRLEDTGRQLMDEATKRHHFEQELHNAIAELASHRNVVATAEREMAKAAGDIKARDAEIALLRSRENRTIVEHVHVLEQAKKVTDRQLSEQVKENSRLNTHLKALEAQRNRLQLDLEDMGRERDMLKKAKAKEARSARASLSPEDKDVTMLLEDERKARKAAEARVAALERDLQDQRKQLSTSTLSVANAEQAEHRLQKKQEEVYRLEANNDALAEEVERLQSQLRRSPNAPRFEGSRAELLRGLQQSHDALGRDMSDQLRRLDAQPLTPSRKQNVNLDTPDPKRAKQMEMEVKALRQQLLDEREEKNFLAQRLEEITGGGGGTNGRRQVPQEQAVYSHFRLKAKSLRTQLDQ